MASDTAMVSVPVVVKGAKEPGVVAVRDTVYVPVMPASLDSLTRMMEQRLKAIEERMYGIDTIRNVISSPLQERNVPSVMPNASRRVPTTGCADEAIRSTEG